MKKINVLFVAYQFPPLMVAGSFRPYKFVKYFTKNESNIRPIIARLSPESLPQVYENPNISDDFDFKGMKIYDIASDQVIKKGKIANFLDIYFNVFKGSEAKGIEENFKKTINTIIKEESIDIVWVTCPPFSIGDLVRRTLKSTNIPFIADMRDAWALWISKPYGSRLHYYASKRAEKKLLMSASAVVGVAQVQIDDFIENHGLDKNKFHHIPNSFDQDMETLQNRTLTKEKNKLVVGYVGSFYFDPQTHQILNTKWYKRAKHRKFYYWPRKEEWIYRSPFFFFRAVRELLNIKPEFEIKIKFAGHIPDWLRQMVEEFKLENNVEFKGYLKGNQLSDFYNTCDLLLLTSVKVEDGKDYCIASKSFDYIKAQKPVIAFVKEGAQKDFLAGSQNAHIIDSDNLEEGILKLKELTESETLNLKYKRSFLNNYSIKETSIKLEKLIGSLVKEKV